MANNDTARPRSRARGNPEFPRESPAEKTGSPSGNWIEIWGLQVHYLSAGKSGNPLLLIHGGGSDFSGFSWKYTIEPLAAKHRVFAVDLPGYGRSQVPDLRISHYERRGFRLGSLPNILRRKGRINPFWFHIHFIKAFLDALGLEKVNLAGISMGGAIALGFSLQYPRCVQKLVLVNSHGLDEKLPNLGLIYLFSRTPFMYESFRWLLRHSRRLTALGMRQLAHSPEVLDDEMIDDAWKTLKNSGVHATWKAFQLSEITPGKFRSHFRERLRSLAIPTLLVHGRKDKLIPLAHSEEAHRLIPDSRLVVLNHCGHLTPREKPEEFNRILTGFLDG